jgi:hypothetical protein
VSDSQIDLSWQDNSDNEDGFRIERSLDGTNFLLLLTLPANTTSYSDPELSASTTYYYRVCAYNFAGDSAYSNVASATTSSGTSSSDSPTASGWQIQTVDSAGNVGEFPSIAINPVSGLPAISYYDYTNSNLKYAVLDVWGSWTNETVDEYGGDAGEFSSLAFDSAGHPHIGYYRAQTPYSLKYATWDGSAWQTQYVDQDNSGSWLSLALDSNETEPVQ